MLEGAVARLLNQILGKYIVDLDTENLNVGIFSGQMQLNDLKLKTEALYELNLPILVKAGTIGKIWLQIPWTGLWNQPITINIEDLHIVCGPIVDGEPYDAEKNKRLMRAFKRKALTDLDPESHIIGGPNSFSELLVANLLNNLQFCIQNVHFRYEDDVSTSTPLAVGLCVGTIIAESTNSKWKPAKNDRNAETCWYLVKIDALSAYWNHEVKRSDWDLPAQYYNWRNAMSNSLQNYSMNNENFDFVLKPMTTKIKTTINKSKTGTVTKLSTDVVIQDCNLQLSKKQYESLISVCDSLERMFISWNFLMIRPTEKFDQNRKKWWKYAYKAVIEQRIKPYTWTRIKTVREYYKKYVDCYKQIILNPNDTEMKLDLQKYEDNLSVVSIVVARQHARLLVQSGSLCEKNFWSMLPSPERSLVCEQIGFTDNNQVFINHKYNIRAGNITIALNNNAKELLVTTFTQTSLNFQPNYAENTFKLLFKIEGLIVEGSHFDDTLIPIIQSEHLSTSPAYFFKMELEKMAKKSKSTYKLNLALDSVECLYNQQSVEDLEVFFANSCFPTHSLYDYLKKMPELLYKFFDRKLMEKWDVNLNIKIPYIVLPESGSMLKAENVLVVDLGRYAITTIFCQPIELIENATDMELEEQLYLKLHIECNDIQVLFCDNSDNWKDARKEKDTDLHLIPKTSFSAVFAHCSKTIETIPNYKFNINFPTLKMNISERRIGLLLKFFSNEEMEQKLFWIPMKNDSIFKKDIIDNKPNLRYLNYIQSLVTIEDNLKKSKRAKTEKYSKQNLQEKRKNDENLRKQNMNEAWARYVDLPGLEDNISPSNRINTLLRFFVNEFSVVFSKSSDSTDRQYLMFRLGIFTMDIAFMTYGPAYQISINSILLTDKLHTTSSGQYLDLIHSPFPSTVDVITFLYRKVSANCPDFWTHFHGVETSLVADLSTIYLLLHQEAIHTLIKYTKYIHNKITNQLSFGLSNLIKNIKLSILEILSPKSTIPVPPGSVKFSHSARLADLNFRICDSDFDILNIQLSGFEVDFLFRANERLVFRSYLSNINVEHLSDITLYNRVLSTDEDKVFEIKYVRNAPHLKDGDITRSTDETSTDGSFKFHLGQIHLTFLYKLVVQLQRYIINLEALPYINQLIDKTHKLINTATETLKTSTKINLAINLCGPVFLLPQKSSSPNVVVLDTGELQVENFFKDYTNDTMENILVKWNRITVTRGVMTLTSTLEMQEVLIEPVNLNLDIKRFTNNKTSQKSWEIDGVLNTIQITLGQRDIGTVLATVTENIGEAQIIDLFPEPIRSPSDVCETDETVKTLEAFFCEPKQKSVTTKFALEGITLLLFFDSGELLSSPIRDLNHGLCKFEVMEIATNFLVYTDGSVDGKLSVDSVLIEEIGPYANALDKGILQSPIDDTRNNNCNITVNRPPIVDVTFHQNKSGDKSVDIIIGRLSLTLSVLFCEKLALFILECIPKEYPDVGIVNPGYENDSKQSSSTMFSYPTSLTISLRINKPEFKFVVETTSNNKRYFITKTEILSDYSRHGNRVNFVVSLSGLHSLLYDMGMQGSDPYVVLKQCDIEFSKSSSEEKGNKITASVSSIYVQFCSRVIHSVTDILNEITEHFKVPEVESVPKTRRKSDKTEPEDLWEPKKLADVFDSHPPNDSLTKPETHEIFLIPKFDVIVIFELDQIQSLLVKSTVEVTIYDWSSLLNATCELTLQANYFNESLQCWEPVVDPVVMDEKEYRPWNVLVKVFQDKSFPISTGVDYTPKKISNKLKKTENSRGTTEDEDSGDDMMYLEPANNSHNRPNRRVKTSLSTFLDDSDSENEDDGMEKLAAAISDLFTGDWNESEDSECMHSSEGEDDSEESTKPKPQEAPETNFKKSTYILVDAKEILNITITPTFLRILNELITTYSNKTISIASSRHIHMINDIGPKTKIELYQKNHAESENDTLICAKTYENQDSAPPSPSKAAFEDFPDDINEDRDSFNDELNKTEIEIAYDFETIASLQFPTESTAQIYNKINEHCMKIFIPNFMPVQTNCSRWNWEKLIKLQSANMSQIYYLAAKHVVGKQGRQVIVSSPLQIRNETCFALNLLYQPSVLQQLNLEPVGDVTNPFETTMRITVLEAYETYNVPLYIAYHCKLFIQPAYAEGHYVSDSGIWWKNLAADLGTAHNLHCRPKSESNLETFSLKVVVERNLLSQNSPIYSVPNYIIRLLPPLVLHNYLPYSLEIENVGQKQVIKVEPGEKNSVYSLDLSKDQKLGVVVKYNGHSWTGTLNLTTHLDEKIIALTTDTKENIKHLAINIKAEREGSCNAFFYAPYWIINKTGLPIQIKPSSSNTIYESISDEILLFTYKRHGKQTLNLKVYESNWSKDFGLECAGTTGLIVCKDNERKKKYLFFLTIKLSEMCPRLIKIVTLLPGFIITNNTHKNLRFMEHNEKTDLWIDLPSGQSITFWPETSSMQMYVKLRDSKVSSQAFPITIPQKTVLRMDKGGALTVDVSGGISSSFQINFNEYHAADAPVLIKNYCADLFLKIKQPSQSQVTLLSPYNSLLYTWDDPTKSRQLVWNIYNNKGAGFTANIMQDGYGEKKIRFRSITPKSSFNVSSSSSDDSDSSNDSVKTTLNNKVHKDKIIMYWACYRENNQRTLLFTQELRIYNEILTNYLQDYCEFDSLISLSGISVSIFTSESSKKEHLHASMTDAPSIWEVNVGHKWKTLTLELASWIEDKYTLNYKKCQLKDYIHIDFEKMFMLKPFFAELRRTYNPAVYFHYRKSKNYQYYNCKIYSLQLDNKYSNTIVLNPMPFDNAKGLNSFIDFNILKTSTNDCYKNIIVQIGNFQVNFENDLIISLHELFSKKNSEEVTQLYIQDMKSLSTKTEETSKDQTVIEYFKITPFKIQLSIANKTQISLNFRLPVLDYLFPINIAPYMPLEGVQIKLQSLEELDLKANLPAILYGYYRQIISNFLGEYYSHVLGLQVLVNSFAYQPTTWTRVVDPEKTVDLLLYGSRCLLGHINMSPAALEQCVVDIYAHQTIENIQRIRRHGSYQKSEIVPKIITSSSRNLNIAVPNVLNQIIVKNPSGLHCDGEMFFRTTGKALLSLITRHPDNKSDSLHVAKEALRRASILGEPIRIQQRMTRYRNKFLGLQPFSIYESIGQNLLETVANCRFCNDTYWSHATIDKIGKSIILVSLEHVIRINKFRLWGNWEIEWVLDLDDIISMPKITDTELIFNMKKSEGGNEELIRVNGDKEMLVWIHEKIEQAIIVSMDDKSWIVIEN